MTEVINKKPTNITSYDLLKTFAVVIMIIDHIGFYFFPDHLWFRAIGRIGFPIWFFLVGYARGRDISPNLLGGAIVLLVANLVVGVSMFPLNALFSIIFVRLLIDRIMDYMLRDKVSLTMSCVVMVAALLHGRIFTEYGSLAFLMAVFGYLVRRRGEIKDDEYVVQYMMFALICFVVTEYMVFGFDTAQFIFMAIMTGVVCGVLYKFRLVIYDRHFSWQPAKAILQFCGRHTLEIYVVHLLIFKFSAFYFKTHDLSLFLPF